MHHLPSHRAIRSYRRKVVALQRRWRSTLACRAAKMELWRRQWHKFEEEELKGPCGLQPSTIQDLLNAYVAILYFHRLTTY
mgnify:CR=1 FL=1